MDASTTQSGQPAKRVPPMRMEFTAALAWPMAVQVAVVLAVTAILFFLMGRWSNGWSSPAAQIERAGPALDLNRATIAELRLVPGLGDTLSQRVVDYRDRAGNFRSLDDLLHIKGIGPKTLDRIRPHVFIVPEPTLFVRDDRTKPNQVSTSMAPRVIAGPSKKESLLSATINVNRADQNELQKLPGIGPKLSQRILEERVKANFKSIDDLRRVPGIGPKTLEKLRPYVTIE